MRSPHTATKSSPRWLQLEKSPRAATKTQHIQKKKKEVMPYTYYHRINLALLKFKCLSPSAPFPTTSWDHRAGVGALDGLGHHS